MQLTIRLLAFIAIWAQVKAPPFRVYLAQNYTRSPSIAGKTLPKQPPILQGDKRSFETRDGRNHTIFEHQATKSKMDFVSNSGLCETTPGVNQYSGYFSVGTDMNMFFWFFEARKSAKTAPLVAWFNGGPGCSSMIGLFQEHGPCQFLNGANTPSNNPNSFNKYANMLYIDQPVGTGFSYGDDQAYSSQTAAPFVWTFLQAFYKQFPAYENRSFAIWTESYGGHYGPGLADYIAQQNSLVAAGTLQAAQIKLVALGINNGWFDPSLQEKAYIDFAYNNSYKPIINSQQKAALIATYATQCAPALATCKLTGLNADCNLANRMCFSTIEYPLTKTASRGGFAAYDYDVYDIRQPSKDPFPPDTYIGFLNSAAVKQAIGARVNYQECANVPYTKFESTGDSARSVLAQLSNVVKAGVAVTIWAGDADFICNWMGVQAAAEAINFVGQANFRNKPLAPYNLRGKQVGLFKQVGNLAFLRVFGAGHEVAYYTPETALQVFIQTMTGKTLFST